MDYLENIKILLGISEDDTDKDNILKITISAVEQSVLNYCNIQEIPDELQYAVLNLIKQVYLENESVLNMINQDTEETEKIVGAISTITESGRTVGFSTSETLTSKSLNLLKVLQADVWARISLMTELSRYRNLYRG